MKLLLKGLQWMHNGRLHAGDLRLQKGIVQAIGKFSGEKDEQVIEFGNHFVYPGLINAHDHLEMNLYPHLGSPPYTNFIQWAKDIYHPDRSPVKEIESINSSDRLLWGGVKNVISGVTSVIHHNPWKEILGSKDFPVHVEKKIAWTHSVPFHKKIIKPLFAKNIPFVIHAAEGIDEAAALETQQLQNRGWLTSKTVLIHAVGLRDADIDLIAKQRASIVWCPASNQFLFGSTARIGQIKSSIDVMLGTDSTLTGSSTLLEEMQTALASGLASPYEIMNMVTQTPARIFNLPLFQPVEGAVADMFITPAYEGDYYENIFQQSPGTIQMAFRRGQLQMADEHLLPQFGHSIQINGKPKRMSIDVGALMNRILGGVNGRVNLAANPLWNFFS